MNGMYSGISKKFVEKSRGTLRDTLNLKTH